jgi:PadR family transcriptional regulator, regulatory protein AphA
VDAKTICLGLLSFEEASGYDLKKHCESTVDHFFPTGFGSIYPALAALTEQGLVTCSTDSSEGRPERKIYRITADGEAALRKALAESEPTHKVRSEFLAVLYFSHLLPPGHVAALLDERIAGMQQGLQRLRLSTCPAEHRWPNSVRFVQGFGAALLEAAIDYMRGNRQLLDAPDATQSPVGSTDR